MKIIAGNWKLNNSPRATGEFAEKFLPLLRTSHQVVVFPPAVSIVAAIEGFSGSSVEVGLQNCWIEDVGAFTGENSVAMAKELGARWVLIGHSERRKIFGETDEWLGKKVRLSLQHGMKTLFCVGETLQERESNATRAILEKQLSILKGISHPENLVIAYEPVWAIGTGKVASLQQIEETHAWVQVRLKSIGLASLPALYGGSVTTDNCGDILKIQNVSGVLVGGASVKAQSFAQIANT